MKSKERTKGLQINPSLSRPAVVRRFLFIAIPSLLLLTLGVYAVYTLQARTNQAKIEQQQLHLVSPQKITINSALQSAISDLLLLSDGKNLQTMLDNSRSYETSKQELLDFYYTFIAKRGIYDQIRILDETGLEVVRVTYNQGQPAIAPHNKLQSKAHRDYFIKTIQLERNTIYISPLELNQENGQIEQPLKPVMRLATPIFDKTGQKRGIVIINLLGTMLLDELDYNVEAGQGGAMLLNAEGFYLKAPNPDDEWGFMLDERKNLTFENDFKDAWATIQTQESGQIYTSNGLFTFQTIYPIHDGLFRRVEGVFSPQLADKDYYWKYVSRVSPDILQNELSHLRTIFSVTLLMFGGGIVIVAWAMAQNSLLKETSERKAHMLSRAVDSSPAIAVITDDKGFIQYVNPRFTTVTGYTAAEVVGINGLRLNNLPPQTLREISSDLETNAMWRGTILSHKKNGEPFWELASISAVKNSRGKLMYYVKVSEDITTIKKMETELRQAKEAAEAMSQAKSDFLANMSHEIRTPMNGVIGMTELVLDTELSREQREHLTIVQTSAEALLRLLNDILDLSKIEAGHLELESVSFNMWETVEKTVDMLVTRAFKKQLELLLNIDPDVPIGLIGDPFRIRQVLVNLIGNAIKFTEQGEIVVTVQKQDEDDKTVTLLCAVTDTGIGVSLDKQAQIFDSFSQADTSITRRFGGTGLGLTISKQLVQMMGGDIWVESQEGQGSTFFFTAPFFKQPNYELQQPIIADISALQGVRVMIIDDNAASRRILQKTLQTFGCLTAEASSGPQGLKLLRYAQNSGRPFDLLLLDILMEPMDGLKVLHHIRQEPALKALPVIILTCVTDLHQINPTTESSWSDYLTKPVKQSDLLTSILTVLGKREAQPTFVTTLSPPVEALTTTSSINILLTEDNEINRRVAVGILRRAGHRVTIAENGRKALERLEQNSAFDLILMDVQMPVMDGIQATQLIRQDPRWQHIPIIALTAYAMKGDREHFLEAGMIDHLSKPIRAKDITVLIERHLSTSSLKSDNGLNPKPAGDAKASSLKRISPAVSDSRKKIGEPEPNENNSIVFNHTVLLDELGGDDVLLEELIVKFLQQMESQIPEIATAISAGDMDRLSQVAHTLKGAAAMMSAERIQDAAYRLEIRGRRNSPDEAPAALADLKTAHVEFHHHIGTRWPHLNGELQPR